MAAQYISIYIFKKEKKEEKMKQIKFKVGGKSPRVGHGRPIFNICTYIY